MSSSTRTRVGGRSSRRHLIGVASALGLVIGGLLVMSTPASAGIVPTVDLLTAADYSVLAGTTVTNTNPSVLDQSVGVSPGAAIVGFPPGIVNAPGTLHAADATALQAQSDLTAGYGDAATRSVEFPNTNPDLVGLTLTPGVYSAAAFAPLHLSGQLVLDGQGNSDAVFIFRTDSTLITGSASSILMINGALECNVFWQVGSSATLGSGSTFVGTIMALTSITVENSVTVHGRALARNGAVTLDNDVFTSPNCAPEVVATTTTSADAATTTSPGGGATTTIGSGTPTTIGSGTPTTLSGGSSTTTTIRSSGRVLPSTGPTHSAATTAVAAGVALALGIVVLRTARRRRSV